MSRHRSPTGKLIYLLFVWIALHLSILIAPKNSKTAFFAFLTFGWHALADFYCRRISSYRFQNPSAKYVEIKNKVIRKLFVRAFYIGKVPSASKHDNRVNILGLVLNIVNMLMFVSFEILLFMPKIPCDPYNFGLYLPKRIGGDTLNIELNSLNEVIPAEASRAFALAMSLVFLLFVCLFERQLEEHRQKIERNTARTPRKKPFKNIEWYSPLYTALVDISVRQNNKKLKFWYDKDQLEQIENLVKSASENAELKLETKGNKLVSFAVIDKLNNSVRFTGLFI